MTTSELIDEVLDESIEALRQTSFVPFWKTSVNVTPGEKISALFSESRKSESGIRKELEAAAANRVFESFTLIVEEGRRDAYGNSQGVTVYVKIKDDFEWESVLRDAWHGAESPNDWSLTSQPTAKRPASRRAFAFRQPPINTHTSHNESSPRINPHIPLGRIPLRVGKALLALPLLACVLACVSCQDQGAPMVDTTPLGDERDRRKVAETCSKIPTLRRAMTFFRL